ncbi:MAG TPA: pyridoxamine 5'-phosphate oxidase family protein [Chitinophagaceae bacterium]|nr:pyridoxamine 5'-phosphate oxidase family protein [Chitinophagaceae bacterium]
MLGTLSETQMNNILSSQVVGRLACTDGKQPYIVPVTYTYDSHYIYGQTNEGMKLDILRKNPKVCFEVDMMTDMRNWQSVVVYGKFEELEKEAAEKARRTLFGRIFSLMTSSTVHPYGHESKVKVDNSSRVKHVMYRIKINKITGRFEKL